MTEPTPPSNPILGLSKPWVENSNSIWLASTISLYRNVEKFMYPSKLSSDRQKQIIGLVGKYLFNEEGLTGPSIVLSENTSPLEKEYLVEHFLSSYGFQHAHSGEAFIIDQTGQFLATVNDHDHIRLKIIDCQGELESTWSRLVKLETSIGKSVTYSFLPKFGFLTADPSFCGTGLVATVFLQLPALIQIDDIDEVLDKLADESFLITGIQGSPSEIIGDVLAIQNNYTTGVSEENIISGLRSLTTKLLLEENRARKSIMHSQNPNVKDQVSRAFGILLHSYQIEAVEALNAISLMKLGVEIKWISGISIAQLNHLFFNCRRSHLMSFYGNTIAQEEIPHKRSEYIHKALKEARLLIE